MNTSLKLLTLMTGFALSHAVLADDLSVISFGGANKDAQTKAYYEPFTKETGIEVITETGQDENFDWKELAPLYPSFDEEALFEPSPQHPYPQLTQEQEEEQERKMQGYFSELEEGNILIIVSEG